METSKICTKCLTKKYLKEFNKQKDSIDGHMYMCRVCSKDEKLQYYRTEQGLMTKIYNQQIQRCKKKDRPLPAYTQKEFSDWLFSQKNFKELYDKWVKPDYNKMETPSVDRKKNNLSYTLENIRLMTWRENKLLGHSDMRKGNIVHGTKPQQKVRKLSKDGIFIEEFISTREAERKTGISHQSISNVCNKKKHYNSAGGFKWEFKNESN